VAFTTAQLLAIAATPLALQKTVQHKGKMGKNEIYILTMTLLLLAAVKLVIYLTPTPALGGG
jgi:hypothetical protein